MLSPFPYDLVMFSLLISNWMTMDEIRDFYVEALETLNELEMNIGFTKRV